MLRGLIPVRPLISRGLRRSLRVVQYELKLQRLHRRSLKNLKNFLHQDPLRLNIGCGKNRKGSWVNIDLDPAADLQLDLREELPFASQTVSAIYSEHFFEHLQYPKEAGRFLRECFRVLLPGGRLDIGVPDTEWPVKSYGDQDAKYFEMARAQFHPKWCDTPMHHLNFHFRQGEEHKYAYDEQTLCKILKTHGFEKVTRREFDGALDSPSRKIGTLYVTARKPTQ